MKIAFLGDVALIGKFDRFAKNERLMKDYFTEVKQFLDECDYTVINLEAPFTSLMQTREAKSVPLRANPENIEILKYIGVDAVSMANNHAFDFGEEGIRDCIGFLENAGIRYFGIDNKIVTFKKGNDKVSIGGFCCYTTNGWHYNSDSRKGRLNTLEPVQIGRFLTESYNQGYLPVLFLHFGDENTHYPRKTHIEIISHYLDGGNVAIIGHHPHVMQGIKEKAGALCAFSLGNFCFDDCIDVGVSHMNIKQTGENKKGYAVIIDVQENNIKQYRVIPYRDDGSKIVVDMELMREIDKYGQELSVVHDWGEYQRNRLTDMSEATGKRLGRRDAKWLLNHMNTKAIEAVLQRKKNKFSFKQITDLYKKGV